MAMLALSGCMKMDGDFTVNPNDTVDGTVIIGVSKQVASMVGDKASPQQFSNLPEGATAEKWSNDTYTGTEITYDNVALADFRENAGGSGADQLSITHEGSEYVLDGAVDMTTAGSTGDNQFAEQMASQALASADMQMRFTFPGEVVETNGQVSEDGRTVTFELKPDDRNKMRVVAKDGGDVPWLPIGIGLGAAAVLGAGSALLVYRKRSS